MYENEPPRFIMIFVGILSAAVSMTCLIAMLFILSRLFTPNFPSEPEKLGIFLIMLAVPAIIGYSFFIIAKKLILGEDKAKTKHLISTPNLFAAELFFLIIGSLLIIIGVSKGESEASISGFNAIFFGMIIHCELLRRKSKTVVDK